MSSAEQPAVLDDTERNELESLLMDFDRAWSPELLPGVVQRVTSHPKEPYRQVALVELVIMDMQRRWSAGHGRTIEEYLSEFPMLGTSDSVDANLIVAEFQARRGVDPRVALASYESRFPDQFQVVKERASQLLDSNMADLSTGKETDGSPVQASVETSRVDGLRVTKAGSKRKTVKGLPVEFGRYQILKELGSGAMGTVYLAHDRQLDRQVALKTPNFQGSEHDDLVTRFYREARAAAKIHHRNICPVYDVGEIDGRHFISMAFVRGRCMTEFIKPQQLPPQKTSAILTHRLAMALAEAHRHNIIHRDLKPANIMIDLKKEPIVMDFGLARQTDVESRVTQSGMAIGTPAYMSPEQIRGELNEVGATADIYALGVILYELLTGELPFRGPIAKVAYCIVHEEPLAPSQLRDGIDPKLEAICAKMMEKKRENRFQSMEFVAAELKEYLEGIKRLPKTAHRPAADPQASESLDSEVLTETGALNAFFAGQEASDPTKTVVESRTPQERISVKKPKANPVSSRTGGGKKLIALGLGGFLCLAGVTIHFSDGTKVEIDDGTQATITTNPNGTLKSLITTPPLKHATTASVTDTGEATNSRPAPVTPTSSVSALESLSAPEILNVPDSSSAPDSLSALESLSAPENLNALASSSTQGNSSLSVRPVQETKPRAGTRLSAPITIRTSGGTAAMAVSNDGRHVATASVGNPTRVSTWDTHTGEQVSIFRNPVGETLTPRRLAYSPDGKWLLVSAGSSFAVMSPKDGRVRSTMEFPATPSIVVFPRRTLALALFHEREVHRTQRGGVPQRLRIWDWQTDQVLHDAILPFDNSTPHGHPSVSPDERFLTFGREHHHVRYQLTVDGKNVTIGSPLVMETTSRVRGPLVFAANGRYAATSVKSKAYMAAVLDLETGRIVSRIDPASAAASNDGHQYGCSLGFTEDGNGLVSADHTGRVAFWNVATGQLIHELGQFQTTGNHQPPLLALTMDDRAVIAGDQGDPRIAIQHLHTRAAGEAESKSLVPPSND